MVDTRVDCFLGNDNKIVTINTSNNGKTSSSILTPKAHLIAHPEVIFDGKEEAESFLDSINVKYEKRNMAWQVNLTTKDIL